MKVAYYDESLEYAENIRNLMQKYCTLRYDSAEIESFTDKSVFLEKVTLKYYDLILLKAVYADAAETEIAEKIRDFYPSAPIVFLNRINETVIESTFCRPVHFLMNPFQQDSFFQMMNEITKSVLSTNQRIGIKTVDGAFRMIPLSDIIYAEVSGHTITIHLNSGETHEITEPMKKFSQNLTVYPDFIMPHRSYIVNILYISHITSNSVHLKFCTDPVPIAKGKLNAVKEAYKSFYE